ncbi:MAG: hypothetical protein K0S86_2798 [Geminicoccaceae bacterium]|nr:hypothetical protein [Geminicoccaceae bacterium]
MLRPHRPTRLIAGAIVALTIGCDEPTAPRQTLPSPAALAANRAAPADTLHAALVALVQDALERLTPSLARADRERVVAPLNALAERLSARDADAARERLAATERALDAAASANVDPDVESLRLQLAAVRSALGELPASF